MAPHINMFLADKACAAVGYEYTNQHQHQSCEDPCTLGCHTNLKKSNQGVLQEV
jgi:hypothetical protein